MMIVFLVGCMVLMIHTVTRIATPHEEYSCAIHWWMSNLYVPLYFGPFFIRGRAYKILGKYRLEKHIQVVATEDRTDTTAIENMLRSDQEDADMRSIRSSVQWMHMLLIFTLQLIVAVSGSVLRPEYNDPSAVGCHFNAADWVWLGAILFLYLLAMIVLAVVIRTIDNQLTSHNINIYDVGWWNFNHEITSTLILWMITMGVVATVNLNDAYYHAVTKLFDIDYLLVIMVWANLVISYLPSVYYTLRNRATIPDGGNDDVQLIRMHRSEKSKLNISFIVHDQTTRAVFNNYIQENNDTPLHAIYFSLYCSLGAKLAETLWNECCKESISTHIKMIEEAGLVPDDSDDVYQVIRTLDFKLERKTRIKKQNFKDLRRQILGVLNGIYYKRFQLSPQYREMLREQAERRMVIE